MMHRESPLAACAALGTQVVSVGQKEEQLESSNAHVLETFRESFQKDEISTAICNGLESIEVPKKSPGCTGHVHRDCLSFCLVLRIDDGVIYPRMTLTIKRTPSRPTVKSLSRQNITTSQPQ